MSVREDIGVLIGICEEGVRDGAFPGAAFGIGGLRDVQFGFIGRFTYAASSNEIGPDTLFDLASLTKVLYPTSVAMLLHQEGRLDLDARAVDIWPEFTGKGMETLRVRHLLRHDSGLPAYLRLEDEAPTPRKAASKLLKRLHEPLDTAPGAETVYSCLNAIYLEAILAEITGCAPIRWLGERLYRPLRIGLRFRPTNRDAWRCAPTVAIEPWRRRVRERLRKPYPPESEFVQGEVHDPLAFLSGGFSGNAGLFGTVADVATFAQEMLRGWHDRGTVFSQDTVRRFTAPDTPGKRPLGWDIKAERGSSAGARFGPRTFGHTGYTGTSIWIDPDARIFAVLLTNRVHPDEENRKIDVYRPPFHDAAFAQLACNQ